MVYEGGLQGGLQGRIVDELVCVSGRVTYATCKTLDRNKGMRNVQLENCPGQYR